jgi:hypothetical protein
MHEGGLGFCPPLPSSVLLRPSSLCSGLLSPYVVHCLPLSFFLFRCHSVLLCPRLCNPPLSCTLPSSVFSLSSPLLSSILCPPLSSSALDGSATGANKWWSLSKWGRSGQAGEEGGLEEKPRDWGHAEGRWHCRVSSTRLERNSIALLGMWRCRVRGWNRRVETRRQLNGGLNGMCDVEEEGSERENRVEWQ